MTHSFLFLFQGWTSKIVDLWLYGTSLLLKNFNLYHNWRVNCLIFQIAARCINVDYAILLDHSWLFVNVAENIHSWLDPFPNSNFKLFTPAVQALIVNIKNTHWRSVSDQDIDSSIRGNHVPLFFDRCTSLKVESPVMISWLPWGSIDCKALNLD